MPNTTPLYGLRYAIGSDPPSIPTHTQNLALDVEAQLAKRFTVCTSITRPATPTVGDRIYETDTALYYTYSGTKWMRAPTEIVKFADQQAGNTSLVDDSALFANVEANSKYKFRYTLGLLTVSTAVGLSTTMTFPSGGRADYSRSGVVSGTLFNDWVQNGSSGGNIGAWSTNTNNATVEFCGLLNVGVTAGTFRLRFAQAVANASPVWMLQGSSLYLAQVA